MNSEEHQSRNFEIMNTAAKIWIIQWPFRSIGQQIMILLIILGFWGTVKYLLLCPREISNQLTAWLLQNIYDIFTVALLNTSSKHVVRIDISKVRRRRTIYLYTDRVQINRFIFTLKKVISKVPLKPKKSSKYISQYEEVQTGWIWTAMKYLHLSEFSWKTTALNSPTAI